MSRKHAFVLRSLTSGLVTAVVVALAACYPVPPVTPTASASSSPTPGSAQSTPVEFYFAMNQPTRFTLIGETQQFEWSDDLLSEALGAVVEGRLQAIDPDYINLWGDDTELNSAVLDGTTLRVDLSMGTLTVGAEGEARAIDQLVWLVTDLDPTITAVAFTVDGHGVESLAGHLDATGVFTRAADEDVLNPVEVDSPVEGQSVAGTIIVSGFACVFEANVSWELSRSGSVVDSGFTMADGGCPTRGAWQVDLGTLTPGHYRFSAIEYSAKDGSVASTDDKNFTVTGG